MERFDLDKDVERVLKELGGGWRKDTKNKSIPWDANYESPSYPLGSWTKGTPERFIKIAYRQATKKEWCMWIHTEEKRYFKMEFWSEGLTLEAAKAVVRTILVKDGVKK